MVKWMRIIMPLVILSLIATACPPKEVPEIADAEAAIEAAKAAQAEKYAPVKLNAAIAALENAKRFQQDRQYEESRTQALTAKMLAEQARQEALEAMAAEKVQPDTVKPVPEIDAAQRAIDDAKAAGAEKYAPEKLAKAEEYLKAARVAQLEGNYDEAVRLANQAKMLADQAKMEALEAQKPPPPTNENAGYDSSKFSTVYFDFDKYNIKESYRGDLDNAASYLNQNPEVKIVVTGFCDPRGTDEYNMALGENRAKAVKNYLVNSGVSSSRIRTVSMGESEQLNPDCHSENCWWKERRVEFSGD